MASGRDLVASWISRHPGVRRAYWNSYAGGVWLCADYFLHRHRSPVASLSSAALFVSLITVLGWLSDRRRVRAARRVLLTTLATDLNRLAALRRSEEPDEPDESDESEERQG